MTEKQGSSQPKKGNNGKSKQKQNKSVKRTIIKIIGFMFIAFIILALLGILLLLIMHGKHPHLQNRNYKILRLLKSMIKWQIS